MVACYLRLGRHADAVRLLRRRLALRASPRDLAWLPEAQPAGAAAAGGGSANR